MCASMSPFMQCPHPQSAVLRRDSRRCLLSSHHCQLLSLQLKQIGSAYTAYTQFARAIHLSRAGKQDTSTISEEEGATVEGKQYECIRATAVGDGTVGLVTPKTLNALSHDALMVEVVDALQSFDASSQAGVINF